MKGKILMGLDMKLEDFMKELGRQREEDQEFRVTLGCLASLRLSGLHESLSKKTKKKWLKQ